MLSAAQMRTSLARAVKPSLLDGRLVIVGFSITVLLMVVGLLAVVVLIAFQDHRDTSLYTLENFRDLYGDPFVYKALWNTLYYTIVVVITSLVFAVPIALIAERTNLPGRGAIFPLMTGTIIVPGFLTAQGWLLMFHPRIGAVNIWLRDLLPWMDSGPINITTIPGMGVVTGLGLSSVAFILVAGTFRNMDPALEESAQIHGLGSFTRFQRIVFPLAWPGVLAAGLYVAAIGMAAFDVPAVLGLTNRIFVFSTLVWTQTNPEEGAPNFSIVGAQAVFMIGVALLVSWWYLRTIRHSHRYAVITGKNYRPKLLKLGRWWIAAWAFVGIKLLFSVVLPVLMVFWGSLHRFIRPINATTISEANFDNYSQIPYELFWFSVKNTAMLVFSVPTLLVLIGLAISWVVIRSGIRFSWLFDLGAFIPHAVPNLIFAVAILVAALFYVPKWLPFYGTIFILIFIFTITRISFTTRLFNSSLLQIHRELDEAGYVFGLMPLQVVRYILIPLLLPAIFYAWIWMALLAFRELTLAAFVTSGSNLTLPVFVINLIRSGDGPIGAALSTLIMGVMAPLVVAYFILARRRMQFTL